MAANAGHTYGQLRLGFCYEHGIGVEQDFGEAERLYRLAAEDDEANGFCFLGCCYYYGKDDPESEQEGLQLLKRSADVGHPGAQYTLGVIYSEGRFEEAELETGNRMGMDGCRQ